MVSRLIKTLLFWLWLAGAAFGAPSISTVSGTLYNGAGQPLTNATVIFNTPQQTVGGNVVGPSIFSTRTNASGAITPITLIQNSVVNITINAGMVIVGIVPGATTSDISQVLTGTVLVGNAVQVNGVGLLATSIVNFQNGTGISITNPSAGNIQFSTSGVGTVTSVGMTVPSFLAVSGSPITGAGTLALSLSGTALPVTSGGSGALTLTGILKGNGTSPFTAASAGTDYVAPGAITTSGLTQSTSKILGRTTASTGAVEEISVGSGLTLSGGTLSSSGGGMALVEHKTITSATTTSTFSGLDGNTDETYVLQGRIKVAGSNPSYGWLPNNLTTNLQSQRTTFYNGNNQNNTTDTTQLLLGLGNAAGDYLSFEITIHAKKNPNSQAIPLVYSGTAGGVFATGASVYAGALGGIWAETSTNLTSIVVQSSVASGIDNGSELWLYKLAQ